MDWWALAQEALHSAIGRGALSGLAAAAAADFAAFRAWKSFDDALNYQWRVALFRWCQGAVVGAATAAGLGIA